MSDLSSEPQEAVWYQAHSKVDCSTVHRPVPAYSDRLCQTPLHERRPAPATVACSPGAAGKKTNGGEDSVTVGYDTSRGGIFTGV